MRIKDSKGSKGLMHINGLPLDYQTLYRRRECDSPLVCVLIVPKSRLTRAYFGSQTANCHLMCWSVGAFGNRQKSSRDEQRKNENSGQSAIEKCFIKSHPNPHGASHCVRYLIEKIFLLPREKIGSNFRIHVTHIANKETLSTCI